MTSHSRSALNQHLLECDPVLETLIEEFTKLVEDGADPGVDLFAAAHPNHELELRRLLPAVKALASLGGPTRDASQSQADHKSAPQIRELGDFRLIREIGRGGMGIVYEAEQHSLDRRVAVKVLPFAAVLDSRQLQRFKNEARAAATLDHPHIVAVYSVGVESSVHFYAMQFIDGQSLAEVIADLKRGPQNPDRQVAGNDCEPDSTSPRSRYSTARSVGAREHFRQAARWAIQAGLALEHAHQMGIVHRDIKPSNLLVNAEGHLWVTDFGLALTSADSDLTMTGDVLGTLRYMSPEQARGEKRILDQRTDVYSLGVTLYELLALKPAFSDTDRHRLLHQILADDPPPLRRERPDVPADLETIVHKAASKEQADRYPSVQALVEDLQRFLAGQTVRARRAGAGERALKWTRRNPSWAAAMCLAFLIATGIPVAMALHVHRLQVANDELDAKTREAGENARWARENERRSRCNQYAANTRLAASLQSGGNPTPGEGLLQRWIPKSGDAEDFRGFEWGVLWNHRVRDTGAWQSEIQWSPWSPRFAFGGVATGSGDKLRFANSAWNGLDIATLSPHGFSEHKMARASYGGISTPVWIQSESGDLLVAAAKNQIEVWDPVNGELRRAIPTNSEVEALSVFPLQARLVWYGGQAVHVWRWPDGEEVMSSPIPASKPQLLPIPGDEAVLLYNHEGRPIEIVELRDGRHRMLVEGPVKAVAVSPSGATMAAASGDQIRVYNLPSGTLRLTLPGHAGGTRIPGYEGGTRHLAFRDDFCVASCGDDGIIRWSDASDGRLLGSLCWQTQPVYQIKWSGDGTALVAYVGATESIQKREVSHPETIQKWEVPHQTSLNGQRRTAGLMALSRDARQVAFVDDRNQIWLVDGGLTEAPRALPRVLWPIVDLRFSDDGARLAVTDERGVGVFSMPSLEQLWFRTFRSPRLARFNTEGNKLVVAGGDGLVAIVAGNDGTILGQYGDAGPAVRDAALMPGGLWLAVIASQGDMAGAVRMYPVAGGIPAIVRPSDQSAIHSLALIPGAQRFLTFGADGDVHEYDCERAPDFKTALWKVRRTKFSKSDASQLTSNGRELASGECVFDVETGTLTWSWNCAFRTALHSSDGRFVFATGTGGDLMRWDRQTAVARWLPSCGLRPVFSLAFAGGGNKLLAGTSTFHYAFQRENNVHPWLRNLKKDITTYPQAWERTIDSLRAWNLNDRTEITQFSSADTRMPHRFIEVAECAERIVTASIDGSVWLWKLNPESSRYQIDKRLHVSPLAERCNEYSERLSRLSNAVSADYGREGELLCGLAVSRDESLVAAIGHRGNLRVWRLSDGGEVCSATLEMALASGFPGWLGWTADDRWLATNVGGQLRLLDPATGTVVFAVGDPDHAAATAGAITRSGKSLAMAHTDRTIRVLSLNDAAAPQEIARLEGHVGHVLALAVSHDGRTLVSGAADGAIKFWSLETFEEAAQIVKFRGPVHALRFSPDGTQLAVGGADEQGHGEIHLLDGRLVRPASGAPRK
jgi:WD40 repeat protein